MDAEQYNRMLDEYYTLHGWDRNTSYPTRQALAAVGLDSVADDLEKIGKLGKASGNAPASPDCTIGSSCPPLT